MNVRSLPRFSILILLPFLLMACEKVFTTTPLEFLQRSPENMTAEQRMTYAEDALASGDTQAMIDAYNALLSDTSDAAVYLAAQLAIEISGISDLLLGVVAGTTTLPESGDSATITDWIDSNGGADTITYLIAAGDKLASVDSTELSTMDYVYGSLGLALEAAQQDDGSVDFANVDVEKMSDAQDFVEEALANMSEDDPSYAFLDSYNTYLQNL